MERARAHRQLMAALGSFLLVLIQTTAYAEPIADPAQVNYSASSTVQGDGSSDVSLSGVNVIDFGQKSTLKIKGDFQNSGTLYAISTNSAVSSVTISAKNIFNTTGAILTTILPAGGIPGITDAVANLSLILHATNNISNAGTISSAGSLTLTAGNNVTNAATAGIASIPVMSAMQNLNVEAANIINQGLMSAQQSVLFQTETLINSGTVEAVLGNLNIGTVLPADMVIDNRGGTLEALSGSINVRDQSFSDKAHLVLWGGDVLSPEVNLFSGDGIINVNVKELSGVVNVFGGEAHITADTAALQLGTVQLSGDPTFFNTAGDVIINTDLVFAGAPLAIIASGNILTAAGAGNISTSSATGNAGSILMVAGADFTSDGPADELPPNPGDTTTTLTINGGTADGGYIDLSNGTAITSLSAVSTAANRSGGDITLIAYKGNVNSGDITVPSGITIQSGGNGSGGNGDVLIVSGSDSATAITVGGIDSTGGIGGGYVTVATATPVILNGPVTVRNGAITGSGSFYGGTLQAGTINVGAIDAGADLSILSDSNIVVSADLSAGDQIFLTTGASGAAGDVTINAGTAVTAAWTILITAGDLHLDGTLSAPAGIGLRPNSTELISVGDSADGNGNDTAFDVNAAELNAITTNRLMIGYQYQDGGLILAGDLDVAGGGAGNYSLELANQGAVDTSGYAITLGNNNLTVHADQGSATVGAVDGGASDVQILGADVTVEGPVSVTAGGTVDIESATWSTFDGDVVLNGSVGGGDTTYIYAAGSGSISQSAGTVSGDTVTFLTDGGNIGSSGTPIQTTAGTLQITSGASAYVEQTTTVTLLPSQAVDEFYLSVGGDFTYTGLTTITADDITLVSGSGSDGTITLAAPLSATSSITIGADGAGDVNVNADITTNDLTLAIGSGNIAVSGGVTVDASSTTTVITEGGFDNAATIVTNDFYLGNTTGQTITFNNSGTISVANNFTLESLNAGSDIVADNSGSISVGNLLLVLAEDDGNFDFTNSGSMDGNEVLIYGRLVSGTPGSWTFTNTATGTINATTGLEWSGDGVSLLDHAGLSTAPQINLHSHGIGQSTFDNSGTMTATSRFEIATDNTATLDLTNSGTMEATAGHFDSLSRNDSALTVTNTATGTMIASDYVQFAGQNNATISITNDGRIESTGSDVTFSNDNSFVIDGTGTVSSTGTVTLESFNDFADIVQGEVVGTLTGSAAGDFYAKVSNGTLTVANVTAGDSLTLEHTTGDIVIDGDVSGAPIQVNAANATISNGVLVSSTAQIEFQIFGGTFTNDGDVSTTDGVLRIRSASGQDLTLAGTGTLNVTNNGTFLAIESYGSNVTFQGSQTLTTANPATVVTVAADHDNAFGNPRIRFDSGATLTLNSDSVFEFCSSTVSFGNGSAIINNGTNYLSIAQRGVADPHGPVDVPVQIIVDDGATATITTSGGPIIIESLDAGQPLTFSTSGGGAATLDLNGGVVTASTNAAGLSVAANFSLVADNTTTLDADGLLTVDGIVSAPDLNLTAIDMALSGTMTGTNNVFLTADATGTITQTAGSVNGGNLFLIGGSGVVALHTSVNTLETNTTAGVSIIDANDITINEAAAASMAVAAGGNIVIATPLSFSGGSLALVSSGNITTAAGNGVIRTVGGAGEDGGSIVIVAGANFGSTYAGDIQIIGGSAAGGNVNLGGANPITSLNSSGTGAGQSAGDITIVAHSTPAGGGTIILPATVEIEANSGGGAGTSGAVTVIGGANAGTAVSLPGGLDINTGLTASNGDVLIAAADPTLTASAASCSPCLELSPGGAISATSGSYSAGTLQNGSVGVGGIDIGEFGDTGDLTILGGDSVTTGTIGMNASSANGTGGSAGNILIQGGDVTVNGLIDLTGGTVAAGQGGSAGNLSIIATNDIAITGHLFIGGGQTTGGTGGSAGDITVTANGSIVFPDYVVSQGGSGATGGNSGSILVTSVAGGITGTALATDAGDASGAGGDAGDITLSADGDIFFSSYIWGVGGNDNIFGGNAVGGDTGDLTIISTNGSIICLDELGLAAGEGDNGGGSTGTVSLSAGANISVTNGIWNVAGDAMVAGNGGGAGDLIVNATGTLNTTNVWLDGGTGGTTSGDGGSVGTVTVTTGAITVGDSIGAWAGTAQGNGLGGSSGDVSVTSTGNVTAGFIGAGGGDAQGTGNAGSAGNVTVDAVGFINVNDIGSIGGDNSGSGAGGNTGNISISSDSTVTITTGTGTFGGDGSGSGVGGSAGGLTITAESDILVGWIWSSGGNSGATGGSGGSSGGLSIVSNNGGFTATVDGGTSGGSAGNSGSGGAAGAIDITSATGITIGNGLGTNAGDGPIGNGNGGSAGNLTLLTGGDIDLSTTAWVGSWGGEAGTVSGNAGNAGIISITSTGGSIDTGAFVGSFGGAAAGNGNAGNAGAVTIDAADAVSATGYVGSFGGTAASNGSGGSAGNVAITAANAVVVGDYVTSSGGYAAGLGDGGDSGTITLSSTTSTIDVTNYIASYGGWGSDTGDGGAAMDVTVIADGDISALQINSYGGNAGVNGGVGGGGGAITLTSTSGAISIVGVPGWDGVSNGGGTIYNPANGAGGVALGDITITAAGDIDIGGLIGSYGGQGGATVGAGNNAGNITVTSSAGHISTEIVENMGGPGGPSTSGGSAGTTTLDAATDIIISSYVLSLGADAGTSGDGGSANDITFTAGGSITVGSSVGSYGGAAAAGGGDGNSGIITLTATTGSVSITGAVESIGGSGAGGISGGNSNNILITASAGDVSVGSVDASAGGGATKNSGAITIVAGGLVAIDGAVQSNNSSTAGLGGSISITYDDTNPIVVGGTGAASYVDGDITADGTTGGNITIDNAAAATLNVDLQGTISADGTTLGTLNFNQAGQIVSVVGPGTLVGRVFATGTAVTIDPQAVNTTLTIGSVTSTAGAVSLTASSAGSQIVVPAGANVSATGGNVTMNSRTLTNDGTIESLSANSTVTISSPSTLNLINNGTITGDAAITVSATVAGGSLSVDGTGLFETTRVAVANQILFDTGSTGNPIDVSGDLTFDAGPFGSSIVRIYSHTGSVSFAAGTTFDVVDGMMRISSPVVSFGDGATVNVDSFFAIRQAVITPTTQQVVLPSNGTVTITAGSSITIESDAVNPTQINRTAGAGSVQFNLNAPDLIFYVDRENLFIDSGVTVATDSANVDVTLGSLTNNGTLTSSASGGLIIIYNFFGTPMTLDGGPGSTISVTGGGASSIIVENQSDSLSIDSSYTFDAGATGTVQLGAVTAGSTLTIGASTTQTVVGDLTLSARNLTLDALSAVNASGAVTVDSDGVAAGVTITAPNGSSATVSGASIDITPIAGQSFTLNGGGGAILNLNGGPVTTTTSGAGVTTIAADTTLRSDNNITMNVAGNAGFSNSGTITSTNNGGDILVQSSTDFALGGLSGTISFSGGVSGTITVSTGANILTFAGSQEFAPGTNGTTRFAGNQIVINAGVVETINNGANVIFDTPLLTLNASSGITTTDPSTAINIGSSTGSTTLALNGLSATITSAGGPVVISASGAQPITFSNPNAGTYPRLNFRGAPVSISTGGDVILEQGIGLYSRIGVDGGIIDISCSDFTTGTTGVIDVSSQVVAGADGGSVTITATGDVSIGDGIYAFGRDSGGTIDISSSTFTIANNGIIGATGNNSSGSVTIAALGLMTITDSSIEALGDTTGVVTLTAGSVVFTTSQILSPTISLTAGPISIATTTLDAASSAGNGTIVISASGAITLSQSDLDASGTTGGTIDISSSGAITLSQSDLDASGTTGGTIDIFSSGAFDMTRSSLDVSGTATGGTIDIVASTVSLSGPFSGMWADGGTAGSISISASGAVILGNPLASALDISAWGVGATGSIDVSGASIDIANTDLWAGDSIVLTTIGAGTITNSGGVANAGTLTVNAGTGSASVLTDVDNLNTNSAGSVTVVEASGLNLGSIIADTLDVTASGDVDTTQNFSVSNLLLTTTAVSSGNININNDVTASGNVSYTAGGTGNIVHSAGATTTATGDVTLSTDTIQLGSLAVIAGNTITASSAAGNDLTIVVPSLSSASLSGGNGITISPAAGNDLAFTKSAAAAATLNISGPLTTTTSGTGVTSIDALVTLQSDNDITMNVAGNAGFSNNGIITSTSNGGFITVQSSTDFALGGLSGTISFSGGASGTITVSAGANVLTFNGSQQFDPGTTGTTLFAGEEIIINTGVVETVSNGSNVTFDTPLLTLRDGSGITTLSAGTAINIGSSTGSTTVALDGTGGILNPTATISSAGGNINFNPAGSLTFGLSGGAASGTLATTGAPVLATTTADQTISSGVTLSSDNSMTFTADGGNTFTNSGTITSSGIDSDITITSNAGGLTVAGNGIVSVSGASVAGSDITFSVDGANDLLFTGTQNINPIGAAFGNVSLLATDPGASISMGTNATVSANGGSVFYMLVSTPSLNLADGSMISDSGVFTEINSGGAQPITITVDDGGTATLRTIAGNLSINPQAGQSVTIAKTAGVGTATLILDSDTSDITVTDADITIDSGVVVAGRSMGTSCYMELWVLGSGGTITNNGTLQSNGSNGFPYIQLSSLAGDLTYTGNGTIQGTAAGTDVSIRGVNLTIASSNTISPVAGGGSSVSFIGTTSTTFADGVTQTINDGAPITFTTPTLNLGSNVLIDATGASDYSFNSGFFASPLTIRGPSGSTATFQTAAGGSYSMLPTGAGQSISFEKSAVANTTINFNGGDLAINTTGAGSVTVDTGVTVSSNNDVTVTTSLLANSGTVQGANVTVTNAGNLTVNGGGNILLAGPTGGLITVSVTGANTLTLGSQNYDAPIFSTPYAGDVLFSAVDPNASIVISDAANIRVAENGNSITLLEIRTPRLELGAASLVYIENDFLFINSGGANDLTIVAPDSTTATLHAEGNSFVEIFTIAGQSINFTKEAGGGTGTIILNSDESIIQTNDGTITVDADVVVTGQSSSGIGQLDVRDVGTTGTLVNNGTIGVIGSGGYVGYSGTDITVAGNGTFSAPGDDNYMFIFGDTVAFTGNQFFDASAAGASREVELFASTSMTLANGVTQTVDSGAPISITTPALIFGQNSTIDAAGSSLYTINGGASDIVITGPGAGFAGTLSTAGGSFVITQAANNDLTFNGGGRLNFNGGPLTTTTSGSGITTVAANTTVASDNNITMNVAGNAGFSNSGTITSTNDGGFITIQSSTSFAVGGLAGTISFSGGTSGTITVSAGANILTFNGSQQFNPGNTGTTLFAGDEIIITSGVVETVSNGSNLTFDTPLLTLQDGSGIATTSASTAINIGSSTGGTTVALDGAGTPAATIDSAGGNINFNPAGSLTFGLSGGAAGGALDLNGGDLITTSNSGNTNVNAGVTLSSDRLITMNVNDATLTNDGVVTTSVDASQQVINAAQINVFSTGDLTLAGNGSFNVTAASAGNGVNIKAADGSDLFVNSNYSFAVGGSGQVGFGPESTGGSIIFGAGTTQTVLSGAFNLTQSNIIAPTGGTAAIQTSGGDIRVNFFNPAGSPVTFSQSTPGPGNAANLNLLGGFVTVTTQNADQTIDAGVTVSADNDITFAAGGASNITNNGTISTGALFDVVLDASGGTINSTGLIDTGGLTALSSNGGTFVASTTASTIIATSTGVVNITDTFAGNINLGTSSGTTFTLAATNAASGITGTGTLTATNTTLSAGSGGITYAGANTITSPQLTLSASGAIAIGSTNATTLTANSTASTVNIMDTAAGNINLGPSSGSQFTLNATNAASGITGTGALNSLNVALTAGTGGINFTGANTLNATTLSANATGGVVNITDTAAGNINVAASSGTSFTLNASNATSGLTGTGALNAPTLTLSSGTGGITFVAPNSVNATNLTLTSTGSVDVDDTAAGNITLNASSSGGANLFQLDATVGNINTVDLISGGTVFLRTTAGSISVGDDITGTTVRLTSLGAGPITQTAGPHRITATNVELFGNSGDIGSATDPIRTTATNINPQAGDAAVYISEWDGVNAVGVGSGDFPGMGWRLHTENQGNVIISDGIWTGGFFDVQTTGASTLTIIANVPGNITALEEVTLVSQNIVIGSNSLVSAGLNHTISTSNLTVQTGAELRSTGSDVIVNGMAGSNLSITNNGLLNAADNLSVSNDLNVSIAGTGTLRGVNGINVVSANGSVSIVQDTITGTLSGSAATFFSTSTNLSTLTVANIAANNGTLQLIADDILTVTAAAILSANNGDVSVLSNGNNVNILANASLTSVGSDVSVESAGADVNISAGVNLDASRNVTVTAFNNLAMGAVGGATVTVRAGTISGGYSETGTNVDQALYDMGVFDPGGVISLTSANGNMVINDNLDMLSRGGNIEIWSGGTTDMGAGNRLFAQGGNIWVNSTDIVTIGANQDWTAVARYEVVGTVVIDGVTIRDFQGGGIAIYSGFPNLNLDNELWGQVMIRTGLNGGYEYYDPGTLHNNGNSFSLGGSIEMWGPAGKIDTAGAVFNAIGGVVRIDPPGDPVFVAGGIFNAFGPPIPVILPPPPPGGGGGDGSSSGSGSTVVVLGGNLFILGGFGNNLSNGLLGGTIAPSDVTKEPTTAMGYIQNSINSICVPNQMAQSSQLEVIDGWSIAVGPCQAFNLKNGGGAVLMGSNGTELRQTGDGHVAMRNGKVVAAADESDVEIETGKGIIKIPSSTAVMIDASNPKILRITNVSGQEGSVNISKGDGMHTISAQPGQEILVYESDVEEEELIAADGLDRTVVDASLKVGSVSVRKSRLNTSLLAERDSLFNCFQGCFPVSLSGPQQKSKANRSGTKHGLPSSMRPPQDGAPYREIAYVQGVPMKGLFTDESTVRTVKFNDRTKYKAIAQNIELTEGEMIIAAKQHMIVRMGEWLVQIPASAIAVLSNQNGIARIQNVWDKKDSAIQAHVGSRKFELLPGNEAVLARTEKQISELLKKDATARRRVNRFTLPNGEGILTSEVSLISSMNSSPLLNKLMTSNSGAERAIRDKIAKMAVVLSVVSARHGQYAPAAKH